MFIDYDIKFRYKGDRRYVQGPDIYASVLSIINKNEKAYPIRIDCSFHSLLVNQGLLRVYENVKFLPEIKNLRARFSLQYSNKLLKGAVLERTKKINSSYDYDESDVLISSEIIGDGIKMRCKEEYTYMEQMVAMTKLLHQNIYPNHKKKWIVTKLSLFSFIDPFSYSGTLIEIKAKKNFGGRLTQNLIVVDKKDAGEIFFSELK